MPGRSVKLTSATTSTPIVIDLTSFGPGIALICTVSGTANYTVQICGQDEATDTLTDWNNHDLLVNQNASRNDSLALPVTAVRLKVNSIGASSYVRMAVVQIDAWG